MFYILKVNPLLRSIAYSCTPGIRRRSVVARRRAVRAARGRPRAAEQSNVTRRVHAKGAPRGSSLVTPNSFPGSSRY